MITSLETARLEKLKLGIVVSLMTQLQLYEVKKVV